MAITNRPISDLESILGQEFPALDHGFIRVVDYMGNDSAVVQAARCSYGDGTKTVSEDRGLIRYLIKNRHTSPLEMCEIKLHVKLPIFVARQWIRHRTANVNELSARYSVLKDEFYIPETFHMQSTDNKQGSGDELSEDSSNCIKDIMKESSDKSYSLYKTLLEDLDVSREIARTILPVSTYTEWYWKIDLHNLLHFLKLRCDKHAQKEIRVYADIILSIVKTWCPIIYEAFEEFVLNTQTLSYIELEAIRYFVSHAESCNIGIRLEHDKMTDKEIDNLYRKLDITN